MWQRALGPWLVVWAACFGLWLLLTSTVDHTELLTGVGAATLAATAFEVVREHGAPRARPRLTWLKPVPLLPLLVLRDTAVVFAELGRQLRGGHRRPGRLQIVRLPELGDDAERNAGHLFVTIGVAVSPNTYVIGFEPERDEMLVHQLVPKRPASVDELFSL
ncbi:MAG: hypothetical protein E6G57_15470 [Actinobacteria bacterium]|nr:MAG: hypothetical protein E6G57_15470 [Actinomycetota bacterium]